MADAGRMATANFDPVLDLFVPASPPDDWGARAVTDWARRLAESKCYDPQAEQFETVATVVDQIYGRSHVG